MQFNNLNPPGLDVSACTPGMSFTSQVVAVDSDGAFHDVWSPTTPNTVRADGRLTPSTFSATLQCVSNSTSGTMSATWDGSAFVGTAVFAGRTTPLRVLLGARPNGITFTGR